MTENQEKEVQQEETTAPETTAAEAEVKTEAAEAQSPEQSRIAELEAELKKAQEELAKEKELGMRVRAEYDNYRKRTAKEMGEISVDVKAKTVEEILPIADNIERALAAEGSESDMHKGVEMIEKQIQNAFTKLQIETIAEENVPFDPNLHNAVMHIEDESLPENTVVQVFQKGYRIGSKMIRYAMVKVAN